MYEEILLEMFNRNFEFDLFKPSSSSDEHKSFNSSNCKSDKQNKKSTNNWEEVKKEAIRGVWESISENIKDVVSNHTADIVKDLKNSGYITGIEWGFGWRKVNFSIKAEKVLGRKILEEVLKTLENRKYGNNATKKRGIFGESTELQEFDENLHTYDMIDIQESIVNEFLKSGNIDLNEKSAMVRKLEHSEKCTYIMLLDVSDSMRGKKLRECVRAALSLKTYIKKSEVYIFAFNQNIRRLKRGEILNVSARGRTDISLALRKAAILSERVDGTSIVFLITDGEPTSPINQNPFKATFKAAKLLGKMSHVRLNVIMLSREDKYVSFFKEITKKVKHSKLFRAEPNDLSTLVLLNSGFIS